MNTCNIYLDSFNNKCNKYIFYYALLLEEPNGDISITHICAEDNYDVIEEISKIINDYENVTVYYEPYHITIINGIKKRCKHAKFEKISLIDKYMNIRKTYVED